jgi:aryl-alcohol dehydrogenase-like predicted oxidoreductase
LTPASGSAILEPMKTRALGKTGIRVSAIGLGCMGMSEYYGPSDDASSIALLRTAVERGITFFDTADMYGVGHNEMLLAQAFRGGLRGKVIIATKFANMRRIDGAYLGVNGKPEYVKAACEMSLKRLGVDHIDLYYQHRVDPQVPIEETVGAMAELVKEGKVRFLGLSEAGARTIRRAHAVHPITALQTEYSLWTREVEGEILDTCRELGISFVAYSPLGRGFLTGALKHPHQFARGDWRSINPRMIAGNFERNRSMVERIEEMAGRKGCTAAQLALAWVLSRGEDVIPIPGTRQEKYLKDNIAATELSLSKTELEELGRLVEPSKVAGTRYDEVGMTRVGI